MIRDSSTKLILNWIVTRRMFTRNTRHSREEMHTSVSKRCDTNTACVDDAPNSLGVSTLRCAGVCVVLVCVRCISNVQVTSIESIETKRRLINSIASINIVLRVNLMVLGLRTRCPKPIYIQEHAIRWAEGCPFRIDVKMWWTTWCTKSREPLQSTSQTVRCFIWY